MIKFITLFKTISLEACMFLPSYGRCRCVCTKCKLSGVESWTLLCYINIFCFCIGPTLVVDGMSCLSHWYSCKDWVCGGQWREYVDILRRWVEAFTSAGIRLVFFFDGVVEEQKRQEWVSTDTD